MTMYHPPPSDETGLTSLRDARLEWWANKQRDHAPLRGRRFPIETLRAPVNIETKTTPIPICQCECCGQFGWWLDMAAITPDVPMDGPYSTQREAKEVRRKYLEDHPELKLKRKAVGR